MNRARKKNNFKIRGLESDWGMTLWSKSLSMQRSKGSEGASHLFLGYSREKEYQVQVQRPDMVACSGNMRYD